MAIIHFSLTIGRTNVCELLLVLPSDDLQCGFKMLICYTFGGVSGIKIRNYGNYLQFCPLRIQWLLIDGLWIEKCNNKLYSFFLECEQMSQKKRENNISTVCWYFSTDMINVRGSTCAVISPMLLVTTCNCVIRTTGWVRKSGHWPLCIILHQTLTFSEFSIQTQQQICSRVIIVVVVVILCIYEPFVINHWTATSSAKWSCHKPLSSLVCGQLLTMWNIVWCLPHQHLSLVVRPDFLWQDAQWPWWVQKWFVVFRQTVEILFLLFCVKFCSQAGENTYY